MAIHWKGGGSIEEVRAIRRAFGSEILWLLESGGLVDGRKRIWLILIPDFERQHNISRRTGHIPALVTVQLE